MTVVSRKSIQNETGPAYKRYEKAIKTIQWYADNKPEIKKALQIAAGIDE